MFLLHTTSLQNVYVIKACMNILLSCFFHLALCIVPPVITVPPEDTAVEEGTEANFTCFAIGTPQPRIQWLFNGEVIEEGSRLTVASVDNAEQNIYTCEATNVAGEASAPVILAVFGRLILCSLG